MLADGPQTNKQKSQTQETDRHHTHESCAIEALAVASLFSLSLCTAPPYWQQKHKRDYRHSASYPLPTGVDIRIVTRFCFQSVKKSSALSDNTGTVNGQFNGGAMLQFLQHCQAVERQVLDNQRHFVPQARDIVLRDREDIKGRQRVVAENKVSQTLNACCLLH